MANQDPENTNGTMKKKPSRRVHYQVDENLKPEEKVDLEILFDHIKEGETQKAREILENKVSLNGVN